MELRVGPDASGWAADEPAHVAILDGAQPVADWSLAELDAVGFAPLDEYRESVRRITVRYVRLPDLRFFRRFPLLERIHLLVFPKNGIRDLAGFDRLRSLTLERVTGSLRGLGTLRGLEELHFDSWRPGAEELFGLPNLGKLSVRRAPTPDLAAFAGLPLRSLWIHAGSLQDCSGAPASLQKLRLTNARGLRTVVGLDRCSDLRELILESCRSLVDVGAVEACRELRTLSLDVGPLRTLSPLRGCRALEHLWIAGKTRLDGSGTEELLGLPRLRMLVLHRTARLDVAEFQRRHPDCTVIEVPRRRDPPRGGRASR